VFCLQGSVTISNDGATIMKLLDVVHPAAKTLVDVSLAQDAEVRACSNAGKGCMCSLRTLRLWLEAPDRCSHAQELAPAAGCVAAAEQGMQMSSWHADVML
jgi:hypothetical protein